MPRISEVIAAKFILAREAHRVQRGEVLGDSPDSPMLSWVFCKTFPHKYFLTAPEKCWGNTMMPIALLPNDYHVSLSASGTSPSLPHQAANTESVAKNGIHPTESDWLKARDDTLAKTD